MNHATPRMTGARNRASTPSRVLFAPQALHDLAAGFDQLATLLAMTLGPTQGPIFNALSRGSVERLSDAGTIARRVVEVPGRGRNSGAMIARHLAWRMHEEYGDGAATAAVLARAMIHEAGKRIVAGGDPMAIRTGMEQALPVALAALAAEASPADPAVLTGAATAITGDPALGAVLGEIVDILGGDAALTIEEIPVPYLDREYVEGATWRAHPAARSMIAEGQREVVLDHPLIMLVDQPMTAFADIRPALEIAMRPVEQRPLLVIATKMSDQALATIVTNTAQGTVSAVASLLSSSGAALSDDLSDIGLITRGTVLADLVGRPPVRLCLEDLGTARKAVLTRESLIILGGAGDRAAIAERASTLRRRMETIDPTAEERKRLQGRLACLSGGNAILKIGAHGKTELADLRAQAEKAFRVLTGMFAGGFVCGGGVAFLGCEPALRAMREESDRNDGIDVLLAALEAPFAQIVENQGRLHPPLALESVRRLGCGYGVDVVTGGYVKMRERRIVDSLRVAQGALRLATSAAVSVFTTGVVVLPAASKRNLRPHP
jgi:chaperonin GroEL